MDYRPCRVRGVIARPPKAPWIVAELPFPERTDWWPGRLLSWRWINKDAGTWTGMVRYVRDGLVYEHAVHGDLIDVHDPLAETL